MLATKQEYKAEKLQTKHPRAFEIKYWCACGGSCARTHCLCVPVVSRGGILLENWRGHEECITLTLPCGATRTPLHELRSATCVEHVGIWLCVYERESAL